jgi:hypothetical protein
MSAQRWKAHERQVAAILNGVRLPNTGRGQPDVIAGRLAVQVKTKQAVPAWFVAAVDQSIRDAGPDKLPVVIVAHARRGHPTRRYLIADLDTVLKGNDDADD